MEIVAISPNTIEIFHAIKQFILLCGHFCDLYSSYGCIEIECEKLKRAFVSSFSVNCVANDNDDERKEEKKTICDLRRFFGSLRPGLAGIERFSFQHLNKKTINICSSSQ